MNGAGVALFAVAYAVWGVGLWRAYEAANGIAVIVAIVVGLIILGFNVAAIERDAEIEDAMRRHPAGGRGNR